MAFVFDTESNGLKQEADTIFCVCIANTDTGERWSFGPDEVEQGLIVLQHAPKIVGHNIFNHDIPLIKKLYPWWTYHDAEDTFIMSSLYMPDRPGGHSVEAWSDVTGVKKPKHEDWSKWSPEMQYRCEQDVEGNVLIYEELVRKLDGWDWSRALQLEYSVARVQAQQELNGVLFDKDKARKLYREIDGRINEIERKLYIELPDKWVMSGTAPVSKPFKKDRSYSKAAESWMGDEVELVGGPFTKIEREKFNLNSHQQVKAYLLDKGWRPTQWNYKKDKDTGRIVKKNGMPVKTSPKLTEDSFHTVEGEVPKLIAERAVLQHRRSLIYNVRSTDGELTGWVNSIREDGRIPAEAIPQATNTGRYRHKVVVNVPKAKKSVIYGERLRELFIADDGHDMVGVDAIALENRIEGHYTSFFDGGKYAETLLAGDPHTANANAFSKALGKEVDRDLAKSIKYAMVYGAQPPKVAETAGVSLKEGQKLFEAFWKANPALAKLYSSVQKALKKKGYLIGLDGRKIRIRNEHSALNALFQCAGSLVVKKATAILWEDYVPDEKLDAKIVLHFHDEFQAEVGNSDVDRYVQLALQAFVEAGKSFDLNIPIEGDAKVGNNWKETH